MDDADAIAKLKARLAQAESRAALLRQAGQQEQYMECYFLVDSIEKELDGLLRARFAQRPA
jgi:hypothetical protein